MTCPLLANSLNLDSWNVEDFKVTTKSKQRYLPISAHGKPVVFRLSSEPLLCPWGVGKFEDLDKGRIALDLIVEDSELIQQNGQRPQEEKSLLQVQAVRQPSDAQSVSVQKGQGLRHRSRYFYIVFFQILL